MSETDYVLGTHDAELDRLGLQHAVWRPRMLAACAAAGFTRRSRLIDFGAGPGYAAFDLADIVGRDWDVLALERSRRFLDHLEAGATSRGLTQLRAVEIDLAHGAPPAAAMDGAWCRWIFAFLPDPRAALQRLTAAIRPGGAIAIMEYLDYGAWRLAPGNADFDRFVAAVIASWRVSGGAPDVGLDLPGWIEAEGWRVEAVRTHVDVVRPADFTWRWPASFVEVNAARLAELGLLTAEQSAQAVAALKGAERVGARMITPIVGEIIARRVD
jgi:SAM-dependent methyltransferase